MLSRHGSNLEGLLSFMISFMALYMCQVLHVVDFLGSRRMETAPTSIEVLLRPTQSQSDEPSDLRGSLSPTSVYSTWQSQAVTHPIMNRARRCLTSVIEHKPLSEHRIPYVRSVDYFECSTFKIITRYNTPLTKVRGAANLQKSSISWCFFKQK